MRTLLKVAFVTGIVFAVLVSDSENFTVLMVAVVLMIGSLIAQQILNKK